MSLPLLNDFIDVGRGFGLAIGLGLALAASPSLAGWREDLAIEIRAEHDCEVAFVSHVVERSIDGRKVVLVKVHCMDQRSFDATRHDEKDFFSFSECTRAKTDTC